MTHCAWRMDMCMVHAHPLTRTECMQVSLHAGAAGWIVGKTSGPRGLYLLLDGREYTWAEAHQEAAALCAAHFHNVFLDG